jgi:hypothetical protein
MNLIPGKLVFSAYSVICFLDVDYFLVSSPLCNQLHGKIIDAPKMKTCMQL